MVTFAITIPNLNQSRFLNTVLESLRYQSYPFQLSIMDGGSTDNFHEVIKNHLDIINHHQSKKDNGQSDAISKGWSVIQGDILAWINSDDYYFPNCFDIVGKIFAQEPKVDVVYGDAIHVDENGQFISYFPAIKNYDRDRIGFDCYICQPACFVRRKVYERIKGIQTNLIYTMDWDLWCQLSEKGANFKYINKTLAAVRYYEGIKTLSRSLTRYREIIKIEKKYANRMLPLSVIGANYYGLTLIKKKSLIIKVILYLFDTARYLRKIILINRNNSFADKTLNGIELWGNRVNGKCIVKFPWYKSQKWNFLTISANLKKREMDVKVNGVSVNLNEDDNCDIYIELKREWRPEINLEIKSLSKGRIWQLFGIKCQ